MLNYLNYMKNARLLTLLYDTDNDDDCGKKPKKLYIHNPNLLNAVCLEDVDTTVLRKSFFLLLVSPKIYVIVVSNRNKVRQIHEHRTHAHVLCAVLFILY